MPGGSTDVKKDQVDTGSTKKVILLPKLAENYNRIHTVVLSELKTKGIISIVHRMRDDPIAIRNQLKSTPKVLGELVPFNIILNTKSDPSTDFTDDGIIAFHILAVECLLEGTNTSRKCLGKLLDVVRKLKSTIHDLCDGDKPTMKRVMDKILKDHVETANRFYHLLLQVSKSPGMCTRRAPALISWVEKLESDAKEYFEILRKDMIIENMEETLALNSVVPVRHATGEEATGGGEDFY